MKLLLDTHILIWCLQGSDLLPRRAEALIRDADAIYVSAASLLEMAIKYSLGRLQLQVEFSALPGFIAASGYEMLSVLPDHAVQLASLPRLHRDPFDRILVAQSISEPLRLMTHNTTLHGYGSTVMVV